MCCLKISTKIFLWKFFYKKTFIFKKISTTICMVEKFPQKLLFRKISTKLRFVGIFLQKNAMLENFPKNKLPPSPTPAPPPTP